MLSPYPRLSVELDPPPAGEGPYTAGQSVSGRVVLKLLDPLRLRALRVGIGWRTEGSGETEGALVWEETVHAGDLAPGEHLFPFAAPLPPGPISYQGRRLKIHWLAQAVLDLPAWRHRAAEHRFEVALP